MYYVYSYSDLTYRAIEKQGDLLWLQERLPLKMNNGYCEQCEQVFTCL